jgi:hypothetical protein
LIVRKIKQTGNVFHSYFFSVGKIVKDCDIFKCFPFFS